MMHDCQYRCKVNCNGCSHYRCIPEPECLRPTMKLRQFLSNHVVQLQQLYIGDRGTEEWRAVPVVTGAAA